MAAEVQESSDDEETSEYVDIRSLSAWQQESQHMLEVFADTPPSFNYRIATNYTHGTLWRLVRLEDALSTDPPTERLADLGARVRSLLPFNDEELKGLVLRMKANQDPKVPGSSSKWFMTSATTEDIVLTERWRRWLDDSFWDGNEQEPLNPGSVMIAALKEMDSALGDLA